MDSADRVQSVAIKRKRRDSADVRPPSTPKASPLSGGQSSTQARWDDAGARLAPALRGPVLFRGGDLLLMRWVIIGGQTLGVIVFGDLFRLPVPFQAMAIVILASVLLNLALSLFTANRSMPSAGENATYLAFDILQLTALLWLSGGSPNPFCLALVLPVRMGGVMLPFRLGLCLTLLAVALCAAMAFWPAPMPWSAGALVDLPLSYRITCGFAEAAGVVAGFSFGQWTARQAARMELALGIAETVLAREQRLSALGALAAATAHELGSPLATIAVIGKELSRDALEGALREDAALLVDQVGRCREILRRLAQGPEAVDAIVHDISLTELLRQVAAPLTGRRSVRVETWTSGPPGMADPLLRRMPELLHALNCLVENAVDFAAEKVDLRGVFDEESIVINVCDDGPGFAPHILPRLGEPYVTSRRDADPSGSDHVGLGLGLFIARTFLERTGGTVLFENLSSGGAHVSAGWARARIEAG